LNYPGPSNDVNLKRITKEIDYTILLLAVSFGLLLHKLVMGST